MVLIHQGKFYFLACSCQYLNLLVWDLCIINYQEDGLKKRSTQAEKVFRRFWLRNFAQVYSEVGSECPVTHAWDLGALNACPGPSAKQVFIRLPEFHMRGDFCPKVSLKLFKTEQSQCSLAEGQPFNAPCAGSITACQVNLMKFF